MINKVSSEDCVCVLISNVVYCTSIKVKPQIYRSGRGPAARHQSDSAVPRPVSTPSPGPLQQSLPASPKPRPISAPVPDISCDALPGSPVRVRESASDDTTTQSAIVTGPQSVSPAANQTPAGITVQIGEISYFTPPQRGAGLQGNEEQQKQETTPVDGDKADMGGHKRSDPILIPNSATGGIDAALGSGSVPSSGTLGSVASVTSLLLSNPNFNRMVDYSSGLFAEADDDTTSRVKDVADVDTRPPPRLSWFFDPNEPVDSAGILDEDGKSVVRADGVKVTPTAQSTSSEAAGIFSPFTVVTKPPTTVVTTIKSTSAAGNSKPPIVENVVKLDDRPSLFQNFTGE